MFDCWLFELYENKTCSKISPNTVHFLDNLGSVLGLGTNSKNPRLSQRFRDSWSLCLGLDITASTNRLNTQTHTHSLLPHPAPNTTTLHWLLPCSYLSSCTSCISPHIPNPSPHPFSPNRLHQYKTGSTRKPHKGQLPRGRDRGRDAEHLLPDNMTGILHCYNRLNMVLYSAPSHQLHILQPPTTHPLDAAPTCILDTWQTCNLFHLHMYLVFCH